MKAWLKRIFGPRIVVRCTRCAAGFTAAEIKGHSSCPKCGCRGLPCVPEFDVTVTVNVHELRILGIWAEHYAVTVDNQNLDNARHESLKELVNAIAERIEAQIPTSKRQPLTLSREFKAFEAKGASATLYRDGREEVL